MPSADLFYYASLLQRYESMEQKLIILAGCNLQILIDRLAAGYTLEPPKENTMSMVELCEVLEKESDNVQIQTHNL